jgi:pyruvate dehydrogenase E1 component alpha subunit
MSLPKTLATSVPRNDVRAASYGMPGHYVPGNDPLAVFDVAGEAVARARRGEGPSLLEIETHRLAGHFMGDAEQYRGKDEVKTLRSKDPIPALQAHLQQHEAFSEAEDQAVIDRAARLVDEAIAFARSAPYPAPEEALEHVFA